MKHARLLSPHEVSDRNAPESAAIRIAEAIVKGDIRPALRNERRSREAFSMAFGPKGAHARTEQHPCHGSVAGRVRRGVHRGRLTGPTSEAVDMCAVATPAHRHRASSTRQHPDSCRADF